MTNFGGSEERQDVDDGLSGLLAIRDVALLVSQGEPRSF